MRFKGTWVYQIGDEVSDGGWKQSFVSEGNKKSTAEELMGMIKIGFIIFKCS